MSKMKIELEIADHDPAMEKVWIRQLLDNVIEKHGCNDDIDALSYLKIGHDFFYEVTVKLHE